MKNTESLKKNSDFQNVYREKKSYVNKYLVMYIRENDLDINRLGISVSKKVGNSVVRHRIKRLIRESYRIKESLYRTGYDIVVVSRGQAKEKSQREIESALMHLSGLHHILKDYEKNFDCTH